MADQQDLAHQQQEEVSVYQLRVWIREISPAIWRRLLVRSDSTIADLHYTLQIAMGWEDYHLHQFTIRGKQYGISKIGSSGFSTRADQVRLGSFRFRLKERFLYEYDFGDLWQHEIRVEHYHLVDAKKTYPLCLGGAWHAPQEDCGGPWAYMALRQQYSFGWMTHLFAQILREIEDGSFQREEHLEELLACRYWLSARQLDRRAINRRLAQYATGDQTWRHT